MTVIDRSSAVRSAFRSLVAERGFHGASMQAVAKAAGVATGTAYVHYASKEELVYATYLEIKADLAEAVMATIDLDDLGPPRERWARVMRAAHHHLAAEPDRARFLTQLEESPFHAEARIRLAATDNPLDDLASAPDMAGLLIDLPLDVIHTLSFGAMVKLIASGLTLRADELDRFIDATWRAVTTG